MARVVSNIKVGPDYYQIILEDEKIAKTITAGQFLNLKVMAARQAFDPFLRRPLSIFDVHKDKGNISLIYRVLGRGTNILSKYHGDDDLDIMGPLGTGFKTDLKNKKVLIIGGGMGIVPLYYLTKNMMNNNQVIVLLGGNGQEELAFFQKVFLDLKDKIDLRLASMDGCLGQQGTVCDLWQGIEYEADFIYTCGPKPMLVEVQKKANQLNIPGQVCLEERMGCGIGVCLSCVCDTKEGHKRLCQEGPVLSLDEVIFNG